MKVSTKSTIYHGFRWIHFMWRGKLVLSLQLTQTKTREREGGRDLFLDKHSNLEFILQRGLSQVQWFDKYTESSGPVLVLDVHRQTSNKFG